MDANLTKLAKKAGQSWGLFKAQLAREGHKIRGDVDYTTMTGISGAAVALREQYAKDQAELDAYALSGGYQETLPMDEEGTPASHSAPTIMQQAADARRGTGSDEQYSGGCWYRGSVAEAAAGGYTLRIERDIFTDAMEVYSSHYGSFTSAWEAYDEYLAGARALPDILGVGSASYTWSVAGSTAHTGDEQEEAYYFEVRGAGGSEVAFNGTQPTKAEAEAMIARWHAAELRKAAEKPARKKPGPKPKAK